MPRNSLAEKFLEETEEYEEETDGTWIVFYDFKAMKPNPRFWKNMNRLINLLDDSSMIQYSVFTTTQRRGAKTAKKLAKHYGAEVKVFKGEEVEF